MPSLYLNETATPMHGPGVVTLGWALGALNAGWDVATRGAMPDVWCPSHRLLWDRLGGRVTSSGAFDWSLQLISNGGQCFPLPDGVTADRRAAVVVTEDTFWSPAALAALSDFDQVFTLSRWNQKILADWGVVSVLVRQGIFAEHWHPAPVDPARDRFIVYAPGKLEYRKGQDLIVAALRAFQQRYPKTFLLTNWQNAFPKSLAGLDMSAHLTGMPAVRKDGLLDLTGWMRRQGFKASDTMDLGLLPNHLLPPIVRQAALALFCSRCEAATSLPLAECLASSSVRTAAVVGTGAADLAGLSTYPIEAAPRAPYPPVPGFEQTTGWVEPDVPSILLVLEQAYAEWQARRPVHPRMSPALFLDRWSWNAVTVSLLEELTHG